MGLGFGIIQDFADLWLTLIATVLYFTLYYAFMFNLAFRRIALLKAGHDKDEVAKFPTIIAAERSFLNMLEQMPPFIVTLWLFSIFCHPYWGGSLGLIYVVFRAFYFIVYPPPKAFIVTFPNYFIIWGFMACLLVEALILAF